MTDKGYFQPLISRIMPLQQAEETHRLVESDAPFGKIILNPAVES
ncbi:MAG: zinc-binding dehydrogenase [Chloroflexi bacterium]|nr:zinc-binding dehydrogenase [Chloroflexota bacterium]